MYLFAPIVFLAPVEVANVSSSRRRGPADNICHGPRATLIRHCAHRPPEGRAGHRAAGAETDSGGQFRVPMRGSVRRRGGVMADRRISNRLKGEVMSTCETPACLYGTETLAMTELQQQRLQVCENNWVRKIAGVTRADRRRLVELREETVVQRSLTERLRRCMIQWAVHIERMADDRLPKRGAELCEQGMRRRGKPRLRWEDCVKRDVRKAGGEEDGKKTTRDIGGWKRLSDEVVKKLRAAPHP